MPYLTNNKPQKLYYRNDAVLSPASLNASFSVHVPTTIYPYSRHKLEKLRIDPGIPNITSSNNIFALYINNVANFFTVAIGSYTLANLLSAIQVKLNVITGLTWTNNTNGGIVTFLHAVSANLYEVDDSYALSAILGFINLSGPRAVLTSASVPASLPVDFQIRLLCPEFASSYQVCNNDRGVDSQIFWQGTYSYATGVNVDYTNSSFLMENCWVDNSNIHFLLVGSCGDFIDTVPVPVSLDMILIFCEKKALNFLIWYLGLRKESDMEVTQAKIPTK